MSQAFGTTYLKSYRWLPEYKKRDEIRPGESRFYDENPKQGNWISHFTLQDCAEEKSHLLDAKEKVKQLYKDRYWSTYQTDYCKKKRSTPDDGDLPVADPGTENAIMDCCKNKFPKPKVMHPVLPPLGSTRKIFGYINPKYCYTPNTVYENIHGHLACEILEANSEINDEGPERQKEFEKRLGTKVHFAEVEEAFQDPTEQDRQSLVVTEKPLKVEQDIRIIPIENAKKINCRECCDKLITSKKCPGHKIKNIIN